MAARRLSLAEQGAKESDIQIPPRRQNETEAAYQRRVSLAKNAAAARLRSLSQTPDAKVSDIKIPPRREGETEDQYQRRVAVGNNAYVARTRAFIRALAQSPLELDKQASETDAAYQARLRLTIEGLLNLHYPDPIPKRGNETDEAYQARAGAALRANEMLRNSLIARPGEDGAAYFSRLTASKERKSSTAPKHPGESTATYQARVQAEKARTTSPQK
jgi:ribosomal protein S18